MNLLFANLSNLFEPIMPTASEKIRKYLKLNNVSWDLIDNVEVGLKLENIEPLFNRIEKNKNN